MSLPEAQLVATAQRQIARILAQLEIDTGCLVYRFGLERIDATRLQDAGEQHLVSVAIEMRRTPGQRWGE